MGVASHRSTKSDWRHGRLEQRTPDELDRKAVAILAALRQRAAWESDEQEALIRAITALENRLRVHRLTEAPIPPK